MTQKPSEDAIIVKDAQQQFGHLGHLSDQANEAVRLLNEAVWLREVAVALRALAHETVHTNKKVWRSVDRFQKKHKLAGMYSRSR